MERFLNCFPGLETLSVVEILSQTGRSCVLLTVDLTTLEEFVVKIAPKNSYLQNELKTLKVLKHKNIVQLQGVFLSNCTQFIALKLEKVKGVCLVNYIIQKGRLSERETLLILNQLISALEYLHSKGWIHQDIKPDNIIFNTQDQTIKLIDFEFSRQWSKWSHLSSDLGTVEYASPEIRAKKRYTGPEVDMWSLGVTLFVMFSGTFPFSKEDLYYRRESFHGFVWPVYINSKWQRIVQKLLDQEPSQRMTLTQLKTQLSIGACCGFVSLSDDNLQKSFKFLRHDDHHDLRLQREEEEDQQVVDNERLRPRCVSQIYA